MSAASIWASLAVKSSCSKGFSSCPFIKAYIPLASPEFQTLTMFTGYVLIPFSFLTLAILAKPSHSTNDQIIHLPSVLNLTSQDQLFPLNASFQDPNPSSGNELDIQCDGAHYGYNPSISDCEGARSDIPPDSEQLIFGERHTGLPESTVPLPYMVMGGM